MLLPICGPLVALDGDLLLLHINSPFLSSYHPHTDVSKSHVPILNLKLHVRFSLMILLKYCQSE